MFKINEENLNSNLFNCRRKNYGMHYHKAMIELASVYYVF
jgi:hypothetical protein